ncbi:palmitoyltransferase ZDHHC3-A-like [Megalops cyprinoides]|uniref:palmitoyltransferase ZDHHC3-A-like n=1 Tax=Megalops cyprinoides TaxID=118141 RepID=UPI001864FBF6|nr:palmitoyltransferase ZDHHC3-A-like [Megalops cyprinoides]
MGGISVCSLLSKTGIERLKGETPTWERVPCWQGMKAAFGGPPSLAWLSPFPELTCRRKSSPRVHAAPQEDAAAAADIIEIPLEC